MKLIWPLKGEARGDKYIPVTNNHIMKRNNSCIHDVIREKNALTRHD